MSSQPQLPRTLVLVGLMGAGKTCIGRRLAVRLDTPFVDADVEIEAAAGCTIAEYFARHGEAAFREGERKVMARLLEGRVSVLASGGGAFMQPLTRDLIAKNAISLWLRADLDVLVKRTMGRDHRPLLKTGDPRVILAKLIEERHPIYAQADIVVDSLDLPPDATVDAAVEALSSFLASSPIPS